jgi:uncharacterized protein (DUF305 family)
MNNKIQNIVIGILIGGLGVWMLTSSTLRTGSNQMMGSYSQSVMQNNSNIDAHFIEQMIPHHQDAITMSKAAQTKAAKPEVKQLAQDIIESQQKEIDQMKVWYKDWYGKEVPSGESAMMGHNMMSGSSMHMGMMGDQTDMERLENAADFDREFVREMIPHHQMAVMMAQMLKSGTSREEMKKLADDIISAQNKEIEMMRGWLNEWE